ncbi:MAG: sensor histidine kinase [Flavobacterium sp.]|uniref:sensor histidine kinase n=1 Tax=Flavobacterium sp. TaxID=239 RepID=UPI0012076711|nr:histidine kinase [Flavobacterium sp.]RZJ67464.1 MAG: sensor histidine kinase [Flavobacterium sp.]
MKANSLKRGLVLSLVVSAIATAPRIVRPNAENFSYLGSHLLYLFVLAFLFWMLTPLFLRQKKLLVVKIVVFLFVGGLLSVAYHRFMEVFFERFTRIYIDFPIMDILAAKRKNGLLFVRGVAFSGVIYFIEYYFSILFERQTATLEIEQLKKEKLEAQLDSLRQQISPHFLFNSLSTLQTIVPDAASRNYILQLSNVYRYLLAFNDNHLATLREELEFMNSYVYILKERFEDAFDVDISIDANLLGKKMPPLALQLLVENAIKHNVVSMEEPLHVKITNSGHGFLTVSNRILPRLSAEPSTGKGLENIETRYRLLSGKSIEIDDKSGYFTVRIPLLD